MENEKVVDLETEQLLIALKNIVETVDDAINKEAEQAAFFCSLSIPDIAGQIEFPDLRGAKKGIVGERYKKWYDQNLYLYENPIDLDIPKLNKVNGEIMYLIRCRLFHQGDYSHDDIIKSLSKEYGENVTLKLKYSIENAKVSTLSDGTGVVKSVEVIFNIFDIAKKIKWNAEGLLREYGYIPKI